MKVPESRTVANLLLEDTNEAAWHQAIMVRNVLQIRTPSLARRQSNLIRARLRTMGPELWQLIRDGSREVATQAVFAAAIKHSPLLADFMTLVVAEQLRLLASTLPRRRWNTYLDGCRARDPHMPQWSEATEQRLATSVFGILAEVGYLRDRHRMQLQPIQVVPEVLAYLRQHDEQEVLRALQVTS